MKSKTQHVEGGGVNPRVHGRLNGNMRFEKHRKFKKDIQIQICKPKQRGKPLKSKTLHVDGGGQNPLVHGKILDK